MKDYLKVAEELNAQYKQLQHDLKTKGIPALKARMEAEGVKILYIDSFSWEDITLDDTVAQAIVMEEDKLFVYGSYWSYQCGEMEVDDKMVRLYTLDHYPSLLELVPDLISDDDTYEESKERPQDVKDLPLLYGSDDDDDDDDDEDEEIFNFNED